MTERIISGISVANPREAIPPGYTPIDATSRSKNWSRELSPFFVGPCRLYERFVSQNVENGWQFSKVYKNFLSAEGEILPGYWDWAKKGWNDSYAHRYPAGKGAVPAFLYWNGEHLQYIESRLKVYLPLYSRAVVKTTAFEKLYKLSEERPITLIDFDVYA